LGKTKHCKKEQEVMTNWSTRPQHNKKKKKKGRAKSREERRITISGKGKKTNNT